MSDNPIKKKLGVKPVHLSDYKTPTMKEVKKSGAKFISYGENNDYPEFLLDLYNNSAEHNAIINSKVDYITGKGIDLDKLTPEVKQMFIDSDIDSLLAKITNDYEIFGGFSFEVVRNITDDGIAELNYVDFNSIRLGVDGELLVAEDWTIYRPNPTEKQLWTEDGTGRQIYYFVGNSTRYKYALPKYLGAIPAIETDIEIQNFHLNHVKNGFFVPVIINFNNGVPLEEEQDEIEKDIEDKFCSPSKAGRFMLTFNDSPDNAVTVERLQTDDLDKKFEVLAKQIQGKILIGHRVISPMLFGVKTEGQLGGRAELLEAYELFKRTYVEPSRLVILNVLEEVLAPYYEDVVIEIIDQTPMDIVGEMTEEEIFLNKLSNLPQELQKAVIDKLDNEKLFDLIGLPVKYK